MGQKQIDIQEVNLKLVEIKIADKIFLEKDSLLRLAKHIHGDNNVFLVKGEPFFYRSTT